MSFCINVRPHDTNLYEVIRILCLRNGLTLTPYICVTLQMSRNVQKNLITINNYCDDRSPLIWRP